MSESPPPADRPRRERSVRYPGVPLAAAIEFCRKLEEQGLDRCSAEAIAAGLGYGSIKTNAFSSRLSAARQFGLLELQGEGYALTRLGRALLRPGEPAAARPLHQRAMASPPLYAELLARLDGRKLPEPAALANVLRHQFEITAAAQDVAARAFHESARFAGLIDAQGHLRPDPPAGEPEPPPQPGRPDPATPRPPGGARSPVRLDLRLWGADDGKVIRVRAPESMTAESLDRLIQALRLLIQITPPG